jgi:hypothetical protein
MPSCARWEGTHGIRDEQPLGAKVAEKLEGEKKQKQKTENGVAGSISSGKKAGLRGLRNATR